MSEQITVETMKVYKPESKGVHRLYVTPAHDAPDVSEWKSAKGEPVMFTVEFVEGVATVPSNLGKYLIDRGLAQRSPIALPNVGDIVKSAFGR